MDLGLDGKTALVTGTGSQIGYGREIALTLAKEGCQIISSDINLQGAEETAEAVKAIGGEAMAVKTDIADSVSVALMVDTAMAKFGKIDILVNNAGTSSDLKPFLKMTREDWELDVGVNLFGQMNVARAVLPVMIDRSYGRIINFSGGRGIPNISVYGAAKAGIIAWTEALAKEVSGNGIIVNCLGPGLGETGLVHGAPEEFLEANRQRSSLKRLCRPSDVAPMVAFMASDLWSYMTGQLVSLSTF